MYSLVLMSWEGSLTIASIEVVAWLVGSNPCSSVTLVDLNSKVILSSFWMMSITSFQKRSSDWWARR